jgi:ribonuclease D
VSERQVVESGPLVTASAAARALVAQLAQAPSLALDTEGDGMFRYRARLCTMQLASSEQIAIVDTLAVDPRLFSALLSAGGPEKVVHDAAFDARLLFAHGVALGSLFDTAVAARFLGFAATGLSALLASLFEIELPKHKQQADWGKRPLDHEAVEYLENDVRHLLRLRDALLERLREKEIEAEVREECAYVLREAQRPTAEPSWLSRVKGAAARPPKQRARTYELARARDEVARELDVPAGRVIASELVLRLAEIDDLAKPELERRLSVATRPHVMRFVEALARAAERSDAPAEELIDDSHIPAQSELVLRKRRREQLTSFRAREAEQRAVDPQAVLPGHCVNDMTKLPRLDAESLASVAGLGACRIARYGERWQREFGPTWS